MKRSFLASFVTMRGQERPAWRVDHRGRFYCFAVPRVPATWNGHWELA